MVVIIEEGWYSGFATENGCRRENVNLVELQPTSCEVRKVREEW